MATRYKIISLKDKATSAEAIQGTDDTKYLTSLSVEPLANQYLYKQAIINGNFDVWQRGTSFTDLTGVYSADRFITAFSGTSVVSRSTDVPNISSLYSLKMATPLEASFADRLSYRMEGQNAGRFSAKAITFSFWLKIDDITHLETTTAGGTYFDIVYPSALNVFTTAETAIGLQTITLPTANTWTKYTFTVTLPATSPATGYSIANGLQINIRFKKTADIETLTKNFYFSQVQLNAGSVALPFMPKSFAEELRDCMRYFQKSTNFGGSGVSMGTTVARYTLNFPVPMRIAPTIALGSGTSGLGFFNGATTTYYNGGAVNNYSTKEYFQADILVNDSLGTGILAVSYSRGADSFMSFDAEM